MGKYIVKKLEQDDILEILIEYFWNGELKKYSNASANLFGEVGEDLRFVGVFSKKELNDIDLQEIDQCTDFNGDHSAWRKMLAEEETEKNTEESSVS